MDKCSLCQTSTDKAHKFLSKQKIKRLCPACCSNFQNSLQLSRSTQLTRDKLLGLVAYLVGTLATARGRKILLDKSK